METDRAVFFSRDLFEYCDIKKPNQMVFDQLVELFAKYDEKIVKKKYKDLMWKCTTPNGQIAGQIPKLEEIESILSSERISESLTYHRETKEYSKPTKGFKHIYKESLKLHHLRKSGEISEEEWEERTHDLCEG